MGFAFSFLSILSRICGVDNILLVASAILAVVYPAFEAYRDSLDFPVPPARSRAYHRFRFISRCFVLAGILICPMGAWGVKIIPLAAFSFYIWFDGLYNIFTKRPFFYVGTTADIDKTLGKSAVYIKVAGIIISIFICFC